MKKLHLFALVGLIMLGLSGCEKAKNVNLAYPDVFVQAIGVRAIGCRRKAANEEVQKSVVVIVPPSALGAVEDAICAERGVGRRDECAISIIVI